MVKKNTNKKESFSELLRNKPLNVFPLNKGDIVDAKILKIVNGTVFVDLNYRSEGYIFGSELRSPELSQDDIVPGKTISVYVLNPENENGQVELSLRRTDDIRKWDRLESAWKDNSIMEVTVTDYNSGGVLVDMGNKFSGFVPISQLDFSRLFKEGVNINDVSEKLNSLIGTKLSVKIIELDKSKDRIILSEKLASNSEDVKLRNKTLKNVKLNDVLDGVVTGVTSYGLFVTAQGLEGLVHLSEISWDKVTTPSDFYKVGDQVKVQIIGMGDDGKRVAYSIKRLQADTWDNAISKYKVGQVVKGVVQRIVDYGVFVRISEGINGLIHISELSDDPVNNINDIVKVGDTLDLKVLSISPTERHLGLSLKRAKLAE